MRSSPLGFGGVGSFGAEADTVPDLDRAVQEPLVLGASRPTFQPGEGQWVVLTDSQGHPFCLIPAKPAAN